MCPSIQPGTEYRLWRCVSDILVGANESQVGVIDVAEECTPEFHLIWLEMMAEQPSIRMFGVPRMQDMLTGAHWRDD